MKIAIERKELQDNIQKKKIAMIQKFEKLMKKGKIDKDEIHKEIMILKGEKVLASSGQHQLNQSSGDRLNSSLNDAQYLDHFQTEKNKQDFDENLITESDYNGVSTFASSD